MTTKIISDVNGKEIPAKDAMSVQVQLIPNLKGQHDEVELEFDASIRDQKSLVAAILKLFPAARK